MESDIDLSLIIDPPREPDFKTTLHEVIETTLEHWQSEIQPDLAVIFGIQRCDLRCDISLH